MDVTIVGLQNAGKTSLLRVLAVCEFPNSPFPFPLPHLFAPTESAQHNAYPHFSLSTFLDNSPLHPLQGSEFTSDSIPTVAFNKREVKKGHVNIKCWDLGGQPRFRSMWERYCRDVNAIIFVVDAADRDSVPVAKEELHLLLEKETLDAIPLLVLGNKSDLEGKMGVDELIEGLDLKRVQHREISCYGVSAKEETNLEAVLQWLVARTGK